MLLTPKTRRWVENTVVYFILMLTVIIALFPIVWTLSLSFKTVEEYYVFPPVWIPKKISSVNYFHILFETPALGFLLNSIIISTASMILALAIGAPAAYSIARFNTGGENLPMWILSNRMFPPIASVLPLFFLFNILGLIDTHPALILAYTTFNLPFAVWTLIGFFRELPKDFEEAAMVDGCSRFQSFLRIVLPLITPGLVVTAIFCFIFSWNEFLFAVILTRKAAGTVAVHLAFYETLFLPKVWGYLSALSMLTYVPIIVLSIVIQRYLVRGLTLGAIRG